MIHATSWPATAVSSASFATAGFDELPADIKHVPAVTSAMEGLSMSEDF
jgi:hypothetical protein